jgi:hypothetical protein
MDSHYNTDYRKVLPPPRLLVERFRGTLRSFLLLHPVLIRRVRIARTDEMEVKRVEGRIQQLLPEFTLVGTKFKADLSQKLNEIIYLTK